MSMIIEQTKNRINERLRKILKGTIIRSESLPINVDDRFPTGFVSTMFDSKINAIDDLQKRFSPITQRMKASFLRTMSIGRLPSSMAY
jgi:hypothetical protein